MEMHPTQKCEQNAARHDEAEELILRLDYSQEPAVP